MGRFYVGYRREFPFLFGGTFIEGGLDRDRDRLKRPGFPFLFGGTFIEGALPPMMRYLIISFPFLFGGTFIEGYSR